MCGSPARHRVNGAVHILAGVLDEFYASPAGVVEHWRLARDSWQDLPAFMDWTSKAKKVVTLHSGTVVQGLW
jgi:hypothetical protein